MYVAPNENMQGYGVVSETSVSPPNDVITTPIFLGWNELFVLLETRTYPN